MSLGSAQNTIAPEVEDINKLLSILTNIDFAPLSQGGDVLEILERLFPNIPQKQLAQIEKQASQCVAQNVQKVNEYKEIEKDKSINKQSYFYYKLSLSIAATIGGLYFGAPLAIKLSNSALMQIYTLLFGVPNPKSLAYGLLAPCKEILTYLSKQYGSYFFGILAAPSVYTTTSIAEYLCDKIKLFGGMICNPHAKSISPSLKTPEELIAEFELLSMSKSQVQDDSDVSEQLWLANSNIVIYSNYRTQQSSSMNNTNSHQIQQPDENKRASITFNQV